MREGGWEGWVCERERGREGVYVAIIQLQFVAQRGGELLPEGDDGNYLFADTPIVETWKVSVEST